MADDEDDLPCYRHPGTLTALACSECERPICGDCARHAPVGLRCPDCAPRPRRVAPPALLGFAALIVTAVVLAGVFDMRGNGGRAPMVGLPEAGQVDSIEQRVRAGVAAQEAEFAEIQRAADDPRAIACAGELSLELRSKAASRNLTDAELCAVFLMTGDAQVAEEQLGSEAGQALYPSTT